MLILVRNPPKVVDPVGKCDQCNDHCKYSVKEWKDKGKGHTSLKRLINMLLQSCTKMQPHDEQDNWSSRASSHNYFIKTISYYYLSVWPIAVEGRYLNCVPSQRWCSHVSCTWMLEPKLTERTARICSSGIKGFIDLPTKLWLRILCRPTLNWLWNLCILSLLVNMRWSDANCDIRYVKVSTMVSIINLAR